MKLDKKKIAKEVVGAAAGIGVGAIVANVVKATNQSNTNIFVKICMWVGGLMLAGLVSKKVVQYSDEYVDQIVDDAKNVKNILEEQFADKNSQGVSA